MGYSPGAVNTFGGGFLSVETRSSGRIQFCWGHEKLPNTQPHYFSLSQDQAEKLIELLQIAIIYNDDTKAFCPHCGSTGLWEKVEEES